MFSDLASSAPSVLDHKTTGHLALKSHPGASLFLYFLSPFSTLRPSSEYLLRHCFFCTACGIPPFICLRLNPIWRQEETALSESSGPGWSLE